MTTINSTTPVVITPNLLASTLDAGLVTDQTNLANLEQQIATGNAINVPSDNPAGAATMLQLQASVTRANQYASNAQDGVGWLSLANSTVGSVLSNLQQVQSLVQSFSGTTLLGQPAAINAVVDQVRTALTSLNNLANTTYGGNQLLFGGTGATTQAYDSNGNYLGGSGSAPTRTVAPGTSVPVSLTGPEIFGSLLGNGQGTVPNSNPPQTTPTGLLQKIVNDMTAYKINPTGPNLSTITGNDLGALQSAISTVESAAGQLGAYQQQVQGFATQAQSSVSALTQQLGSVQSTNVAQAITALQLQQTSYQEALYATSQLSTDSLAKYL